MTIYSVCSGKTIPEAESEFKGEGYATFKLAVGETVADFLAGVHGEYNRIRSDKAYLTEIMANGASKASYIAQKTLSKVMRKVGFVKL